MKHNQNFHNCQVHRLSKTTDGSELLERLEAAAAEGLTPNLRRFLAFLGWTAGEVFELQALHVPADKSIGRWKAAACMAAHGSTLATLERLATQGDALQPQGVYAIFNRVDPGVQHRRGPDAWHEVSKGEGTSDRDITHRRALYIDLDPQRTRGISASRGELLAAWLRAERAQEILIRTIPEEAIGVGLSGNGAALFVALEPMAPEGEPGRLVKAALVALAGLLDDDVVKVDTSVSDPKRLCFLPGTVKRKGAHSNERPHRRAAFLGPETPRRLTLDELRGLVLALRDQLPEDRRADVDKELAGPPSKDASRTAHAHQRAARAGGGERACDVVNRTLPVQDVLSRLGLLDGDRPICPGCRESDKGVAIVGNGLKCHHNRCANRGYNKGFRTVVDLIAEVEGLDVSGVLSWVRAEFPGVLPPEAARLDSPRPAAHDGPRPATHDERPVIYMSADLPGNTDSAVRALAAHPDIYTRGLSLVQIVDTADPEAPEKKGVAVLRTLPRPTLREILVRVASWRRADPRSGEWREAIPTDAIVQSVESRGYWPELRPIVGIVHTPFLRRDGSVCIEPGYDEATGFALVCRESFPPIPEAPTQGDAHRALLSILDLFCDFPFVNEAARHVPVAALLTMLAMPALGGANVPAFLFEANAPGTGKGLTLDTICILATGREVPKSPWAHDEEIAKVLGAAALEGASVLAFDNISPEIPFGGAAIELVLTCSGQYKPRILGRSETPTLPWRAVVMGTGNNIIVRGDTRRRVLLCTQRSELENPETREGFKYPHLRQVARARRAELVTAALTLLRAHALAGRPTAGVRRVGSFEEWCSMIASAIAWAGGACVLDAMPRSTTSDDPILSALGVLLEAWPLFDPAAVGLRLGALADKLYPPRHSGDPGEDDGLGHVREALELLAPARGGGAVRFDARKLGYVLRAHRGRNLGGRAFEEGSVNHGAKTWRVVDPMTGEGVRHIDAAMTRSVGGSGGSGGSFSSDAGAINPMASLAHAYARAHAHAGSAPDAVSYTHLTLPTIYSV